MKKVIAIVLSFAMVLTSIVAFAATSDAEKARNFIEIYNYGSSEIDIDGLDVKTLVGKSTPNVHEIEVEKNALFNYNSTLDMQLVEDVFKGMKYALTLESAEIQALLLFDSNCFFM